MDISVSYAIGPAQASVAVQTMRKLEVARTVVGLVVGLVGAGVCLSLDGDDTVGTVGAGICLFVVLVIAVLAASWLQVVARVSKTAPASSLPGTVTFSDAGLSVAREGSPVTQIAWNDVLHCTNVAATWVFAIKGDRDAVLIPHSALTPEQRLQVATLLGTWPKRRYRNLARQSTASFAR